MGERTGWAARPGTQLVGSALVTIHHGGHWRCLVVAICCGRWHRLVVIIRFRSVLTSFLAVHRAPLSLVRSCPGRRTIVGVDAGGVTLMVCMRPVVARGGRAWFSWALVVVCALSCHLCTVVSFAHGRVVCAWSCHMGITVKQMHAYISDKVLPILKP